MSPWMRPPPNKPVATLAGHAATVTFSGATTFTAVATVASGDAQGNVTYTLRGMYDLLGNQQAMTVITGTLGAVFDSVAPSLTAVTGASNHAGRPTFAVVGDQVTLTLQADETIDATTLPVVTLAGRSATVQAGTSPTTVVTAILTLLGSDTTGSIGYTVGGSLCDLAGNCNGALSPASGSTGVTFA
ncbi:hypothetical protein PAPYR_9706 [Paratrimastix pyriformis]|uniref:Uncharacterized protein n=1 Tax=Paratrimastix pyriformis TaxID=342808 RepID=A0ABQ8U7Q5_9EUKA|nr:hypothetical protein PAPYR_9706 [Paratrimastix pyriformis]